MSDDKRKRVIRGWEDPDPQPKTMAQIRFLEKKRRMEQEAVDNLNKSVDNTPLPPVDKDSSNASGSIKTSEVLDNPGTFPASQVPETAGASRALGASDNRVSFPAPEAADTSEPSPGPEVSHTTVTFPASRVSNNPRTFPASQSVAASESFATSGVISTWGAQADLGADPDTPIKGTLLNQDLPFKLSTGASFTPGVAADRVVFSAPQVPADRGSLDTSEVFPASGASGNGESFPVPQSFNDLVSYPVTGVSYAPEPFDASEPAHATPTFLKPLRKKDGYLIIRQGYSRLDWQVYQLMKALTPHEFVVYFDLYYRSWGQVPACNFCRCIYADIIKTTGLSKTTVKNAVKTLRSMGLIITGPMAISGLSPTYFSVFIPSEIKDRLGFKITGDDPVWESTPPPARKK